MNKAVSPAATRPARSERVATLQTSSGITIWHVEDYTVPVVSVEFAFMGGGAEDPSDRTGLSNLMASLLDEGAGSLDAEAFPEALEERAIELSFDCGRDRLDGSMRTLAAHQARAFELLALALQSPKFDQEAIDRVRAQVISSLKRDESDPQARAREALYRIGFAGHSYGRLVDGKIDELQAITRDEIAAQHRRLIARANLHVVAVGAISAADLIAGVERAFGPLPDHPVLGEHPLVVLKGQGTVETIDIDIPQSTLLLALPGLARKDPDFIAGNVVNHILGGGSFTSRFWTEVREKRGLAYSVWSQLIWKRHSRLFLAGTATSNERVGESFRVMQEEIARMAAEGPSAEELRKAQSYLTGSYALRFDTSRKIANQLMELAVDGLGVDYMDRRNDEVNAVTIEAARAAAARLFKDAKPFAVAAGRPVGLERKLS
jgi:zinc protease